MPLQMPRNYRALLEENFILRQKKNPGYSLRAFARDLEMPASKLSEVLRGLCGLSSRSAAKIAKKLGLTDDQTHWFIRSVEATHGRSEMIRQRAEAELASLSGQDGFAEISLERFRAISDWYCFALMELTETEGFQSKERWIASRLGISVEEVRAAIRNLMEFGLLRANEKGSLVQTKEELATPSGIPSAAIRTYHGQILGKAQEALERCPVDERDYSSMTMSFSERQMVEARKMLKDFRREFNRVIQAHRGPKERVYSLAIQFFPLDIRRPHARERGNSPC